MSVKPAPKGRRWPKSNRSWKEAQLQVRTRKKTILALIVLVAVAGLLIISMVARLTRSVFSHNRNYSWNGEFNINMAVKAKRIAVLVFSPKEDKIVIIDIPDETLVDVPYGFGSWQLQAVYDFGESPKNMGGGKLLSDSLTSLLAVPIDGYLDFGPPLSQKTPSEIVDILRSSPFSSLNLVSHLKTNLSVWELFKLQLKLYNVRFDKITKLDLIEVRALDKANLPDQTPVFTADPVKLDSILTSVADPEIISERKSIAVLNTTDHPQLALKWARLITNLGGNVIITANAQKKLPRTQVVGPDSATLRRLKQVFELGCQEGLKCGKVDIPDEDAISQRADIHVLIGEDFAGR